MNLSVESEVVLTPRDLSDLFTSAFEGGMTVNWCHQADVDEAAHQRGIQKAGADRVVWWGLEGVFDGDFTIELCYDDPEGPEGNGEGHGFFNQDKVREGLQIMARDYPKHWADFRSENGDAITADVFLQCVVFGKIIYG